MPLPKWLVPAATGLAGLVAGLLINHSAESDPAAPGRESAAVFPGATAAPASATAPSVAPVTLEDLRRVVREELAAMPQAGASQGGGDPALQDSSALSIAEQNTAATQARAVLDAALSRRSWTDDDREALHAQFPVMSAAQRDEWLQQYAQAVNQGRLIPDSERPPF